jgi:hypothetical protein
MTFYIPLLLLLLTPAQSLAGSSNQLLSPNQFRKSSFSWHVIQLSGAALPSFNKTARGTGIEGSCIMLLNTYFIIWRKFYRSCSNERHGRNRCARAVESTNLTLIWSPISPPSASGPPTPNSKRCIFHSTQLPEEGRGTQRAMAGERTEGLLLDVCGSELRERFDDCPICNFIIIKGSDQWNLLH